MLLAPKKLLPPIVIFSDDVNQALSLLKQHDEHLYSRGYRHLLYAEQNVNIDDELKEYFYIQDFSFQKANYSNALKPFIAAHLYSEVLKGLSYTLQGGMIIFLDSKYISVASFIPVNAILFASKAPIIDKRIIYVLAQVRLNEQLIPFNGMYCNPWQYAQNYFLENPQSAKLSKKHHSVPHSFYDFDIEMVEVSKKINSGVTASTYKARNENKDKFAIRKAPINDMEIGILNKVKMLKSIIQINDKEYILMEYAPGKDLDKLIGLNLKQNLFICLLLSIELQKIHQLRIVHADIKESNVRVKISKENKYDIKVKIIDFNISVFLHQGKCPPTKLIISDKCWHLSPEFSARKSYDFRTDIYSLGCLFRSLKVPEELYRGMLEISPLKRDTLEFVINKLINLLQIQPNLDPHIKRFISEMQGITKLNDKFGCLTLKENKPMLYNYNNANNGALNNSANKSPKSVQIEPTRHKQAKRAPKCTIF